MTNKAKVPDDGEAKRVRVRDLIRMAHHRGLLGHEVRAKLDKEVLEEGIAVTDVGPQVPPQKKPPCGDDADESVRAVEICRQKAMVGELAPVVVQRVNWLRVSRFAREDIAQDTMARALSVIDRGPLMLDDDPGSARIQMTAYLTRVVRSAYLDHIKKVAAHAVSLAEYPDEIELPRTVEGGESAEKAFFSMADKSMARALTDGFASSMDDAVKEAERMAAAMHDMVGTKELLALILHKAFAVPADVVAEMIDSSRAGVRMACAAAAPKLRKSPAKQKFLMRLRPDAD
jgi:DNA-directed RNA polymerase specialized sigma24 family protein